MRSRLPDGVTFSGGVAEVAVVEAEAIEDALRRADTAPYEAKRSGRDRVL